LNKYGFESSRHAIVNGYSSTLDSEILVAKISDFEKIVEGNYQLLSFYKKMIDSILVAKEE